MNPSQFPLFDAHMHFSREHVDAVLAGAEECGVIGGLNIWVGGMYHADYAEYLAEWRRRDLRHLVNFWWPDWTREEVFARRDCVIQAHPELTFLLCHAGNDIESIARFTELMERFPNVTAELGRELERHDPPDKIHTFCERFAGRLYMGWDIGYLEGRRVDVPWNRDEAYDPMHRRMSETWGLTGDTLEKIAWRNGRDHWLEGRKYRRV